MTAPASNPVVAIPDQKTEIGTLEQRLIHATKCADVETVNQLLYSKQYLEAKAENKITVAALKLATDGVRKFFNAIDVKLYLMRLPGEQEFILQIKTSSDQEWVFARSANDAKGIEAATHLILAVHEEKTIKGKTTKDFRLAHSAAKSRYLRVIMALLEAGAYLNIEEATKVIKDFLSSLASFIRFFEPEKTVAENAFMAWIKWTELHHAAGAGNTEQVRSLVRTDDVNAQDSTGRTALFVAAARNHAEVVDVLLAAKADPTLAYHNGERRFQITPLMIAAQSGHVAIVASLLKVTLDPHAFDSVSVDLNEKTALHYAVCGFPSVMTDVQAQRKVIQQFQDLKPNDQSAKKPAYHQASAVPVRNVSHEEDINLALVWAAFLALQDVVIMLLSAKAQPVCGTNGMSALHAAVSSKLFVTERDRFEVLDILLASVFKNTLNKYAEPVIAAASSPGGAAYLINKGADVFAICKKVRVEDGLYVNYDVLGSFVRKSIRNLDLALPVLRVLLTHYTQRRRETREEKEIQKIQESLDKALEYTLFCNNARICGYLDPESAPCAPEVVQALLAAGANIFSPKPLQNIFQELPNDRLELVLNHAYLPPTAFKVAVAESTINLNCIRVISEWSVRVGVKPEKWYQPRYARVGKIPQSNGTALELVDHLKVIFQKAQEAQERIEAAKKQLEKLVEQLMQMKAVKKSAAFPASSPLSSLNANAANTGSDPGDEKNDVSILESKQDPILTLIAPTTVHFEGAWDYMLNRQNKNDDDLKKRNIFFALLLVALDNNGRLPDTQIDIIHILELAAEQTNQSGHSKNFMRHCNALLKLHNAVFDQMKELPRETRSMQIQRLLGEYHAFLLKKNIKITPLYATLMNCVSNWQGVLSEISSYSKPTSMTALKPDVVAVRVSPQPTPLYVRNAIN